MSNETRLSENQSNVPAANQQQNMNQMYYRPNEANFNYQGITFNVNIPEFVSNIKRVISKAQERKAIRELRQLEGKTLRDTQHHSNKDVFSEIIDEIEED